MSDWFVLYVRTACEERVLGALKKRIDADTYTPFIPRKWYPHVKAGVVIGKELKPCFPGYVFVRSLKGDRDSIPGLRAAVQGMNEAYYFLCYGGDKTDMALREKERNFLERLMNAEFCMEPSLGFIEGERVRVVSGALMGVESQIVKINKGKRTAVIEIDMFKAKRKITLMMEILEKMPDDFINGDI